MNELVKSCHEHDQSQLNLVADELLVGIWTRTPSTAILARIYFRRFLCRYLLGVRIFFRNLRLGYRAVRLS